MLCKDADYKNMEQDESLGQLYDVQNSIKIFYKQPGWAYHFLRHDKNLIKTVFYEVPSLTRWQCFPIFRYAANIFSETTNRTLTARQVVYSINKSIQWDVYV